ncbi:Metallothiol transferase FosB [Bacillus subtilis]
MEIKGINHLLFSVSHLDTSIDFYQKVFGAKLLVKGRTTAYFDMNGIWLALNEEPDIPRNDIKLSYTHIAFTIEDHEFEEMSAKLKRLHVNILPGRERDERDRKKRICTFMMKRPFDITTIFHIRLNLKKGVGGDFMFGEGFYPTCSTMPYLLNCTSDWVKVKLKYILHFI